MSGDAPASAIGSRVRLGLAILQALATSRVPIDALGLSATLDSRPDLVGEVASRLALAGWVAIETTDGRPAHRLATVDPEPTLYEVVDAVEGASAADDCALGLGPCGALTGRPVCRAHEPWLRQLSAGALLAAPLAGIGTAHVGRVDAPPVDAPRGKMPSIEARPLEARPAEPRPTAGLAPADPHAADGGRVIERAEVEHEATGSLAPGDEPDAIRPGVEPQAIR